ncbi:MAG TPA: YraN family protein [Longimicrobiales bacterium]|nr:YraN family protein [Longimicrobiales bacterium]
MAEHNDYGARAEDLAARALADAGWEVMHRNWRWRHKELDIVARKGDIVAFVEVRARRSTSFGHPAATITRRKQRDLATAAWAWVAAHGRRNDVYRFDVVTVTGLDGAPDHLEAAWYP